jgi:hypothetical protein
MTVRDILAALIGEAQMDSEVVIRGEDGTWVSCESIRAGMAAGDTVPSLIIDCPGVISVDELR